MKESLDFSDRQTKLFLAAAILSGFVFMFIANENILLSLLTVFGGDDFPREGVVFFDMGNNSCEHYTLEKYLPAGRKQILDQNAEECPVIWKAVLKIEKLESINRSTNSSEINHLLVNASEAFENHNWQKVNRITDRLEIERSYSVKN